MKMKSLLRLLGGLSQCGLGVRESLPILENDLRDKAVHMADISNILAKAGINSDMMKLLAAGIIRLGGKVKPDILPGAGAVLGGYGSALSIFENVKYLGSLPKLLSAAAPDFAEIAECSFNAVCDIYTDGFGIYSVIKCFSRFGFSCGKIIVKNSPLVKAINIGFGLYGLLKSYVKAYPDSCLKPVTDWGDKILTVNNVWNVLKSWW